MFNIYLNNGDLIPDGEQACYVIAKDGVYLKKNLGMVESITKVSEITFLETLKEEARLNIQPLPAKHGGQIKKFFHDVCTCHNGSEAISLLYYNQETYKYRIVSPPQIVSGGACDFKREISMTMEGFNLVGDIHSHGRGSAFHSSIDDRDEKTGVDGLHITFGHVSSDEISISASITVNGKRFQVEPEQYLEGCKKVENTKTDSAYAKKTYKMVDGKLVLQPTKANQINSYLSQRYTFDVSDTEVEYPPEWFANVEYIVNAYKKGNYANSHGSMYGYDNKIDDWENHWNSQYQNFYDRGRNFSHGVDGSVIGEGYICEQCPYKAKALNIDIDPLSKDDGSAAYDPEVDKIVEDQLTNDDFLDAASTVNNDEDLPGDEELPENLKGKPKSWIREWLGRLPS